MNSNKPTHLATEESGKPGHGRPSRAAAVLRAAREIFFEHGFAAATTDMIQRAAGVSKSTLYAHFPNKEGIFAAVITAECNASVLQVRSLRTPDASIDQRLMAVALAYLDIVLRPDGLALYRIVIAEAPRTPDLARCFYEAGPAAINHYLEELLAAASASGEISLEPVSVGKAAAMLSNMIRGEVHMRALTELHASPDADQRSQWAALAVSTFLRAYGKGRSSGNPST